jgi:hypothetical protein
MNDHEQNIEIMKDLRSKLDAVINKENVKHPDPIKHKYISFIKSAFRIAAGLSLGFGFFQAAGGLLVLAEVLGVAEEMV